jgi:hypothetical protein
MFQQLLADRIKTTYGKPQYNYVRGEHQRIELHRGCPHGHEYCLEPQISEDFPIPILEKNYVEILDMNLLARKDALDVIRRLGEIKVNGTVIYYEAVCGFDFRFLTQEIADAFKASRFIKIRLAWDGPFSDQLKIKDALRKLLKAGYRAKEISFFMIVNWRIPRTECERKLDLLKIWGCKVCDCCYDGGYRFATPMFWNEQNMREFRTRCRKHNQLINFGIDPEEKREAVE